VYQPQHHDQAPFVQKTPKARKSAPRLKCDRERADKQQARLRAAADDSCHTAPDVILPFSITGNLIQVNPSQIGAREETSESGSRTTPPPPSSPMKPFSTPLSRRYFDISVSKKQLFSSATGTPAASPSAAQCSASRPPAAPQRATLPNQITYQEKKISSGQDSSII
jgi:hypothetical protein